MNWYIVLLQPSKLDDLDSYIAYIVIIGVVFTPSYVSQNPYMYH